MDEQRGELGLSEFIMALRNELIVAMDEGQAASLRFVPGPIDLELQVHAERDAKAEGKIGFKVFGTELGASAGGGLASGSYQTLKMRLEIAQKPGAAKSTISTRGVKPRD